MSLDKENGTGTEFEERSDDKRLREETSSQLALPSHMGPSTLYILPLTERPFFPAQTLPLLLNEEPWLGTIKLAAENERKVVGLLLTRSEQSDQLSPGDFHQVGTLVRMHQVSREQGKIQMVAEGIQRFRVREWLSPEAPFLTQVDYPTDHTAIDQDEVRAYAMALIEAIKDLLTLNPLYSEELRQFFSRFHPNDPAPLTDFAAAITTAGKEDLQSALEAIELLPRMKKVLLLIKKELEVARLQSRIREQVEQRLTEQQRKFFLREQLKIIQQELGLAKDDKTAELERFRGRLESLELSAQARTRIEEELQKLSVLELGSPEYGVTRNYLDVITGLPWGRHSEDHFDLDQARAILDRDHEGLEDAKERMIEFLAVGGMRGEIGGSIVLLVGPPGVGKTSIGRSIAQALGRKLYRFSVGGMRDEAEIKGHRRTYIGAMPGKIIQALQDVGVANPVILLDEVDKIGASYHGDPASALLEVLDPEQNREFLDHYLDVRFDLSRILFICTANQLDTIPSALLDRMEVIRLAGYVTTEKVRIARNHLWPRLRKRNGLKARQVTVSEAALRAVVEGYAREAGVRNLEKQLGKIARKAAVRLLRGETEGVRVGVRNLTEFLGQPLFREERPISGVGVVTGLAWTALGGATLSVEASIVHRQSRGLTLTGKLGEVMQESATIAYDHVSARLAELAGPTGFFDDAHVHIHVPEGATPKDGPSAGITIALALLSLARGQGVRKVAMTGELTLSGLVLPVGGIREKVIAARRGDITELILPELNRRDFDELPDYLRAGLSVHFASRFHQVPAYALGTEALAGA